MKNEEYKDLATEFADKDTSMIDELYDKDYTDVSMSDILFQNKETFKICKCEEVDWDEIIEKYKVETKCSVFATYTFTRWLKQNYNLTKK